MPKNSANSATQKNKRNQRGRVPRLKMKLAAMTLFLFNTRPYDMIRPSWLCDKQNKKITWPYANC
jgi:hypothetical protein